MVTLKMRPSDERESNGLAMPELPGDYLIDTGGGLRSRPVKASRDDARPMPWHSLDSPYNCPLIASMARALSSGVL